MRFWSFTAISRGGKNTEFFEEFIFVQVLSIQTAPFQVLFKKL
jgi:hypothetical protein